MIEDSNPNLGIYDMRIELPEDAPQFLYKSLNINICNKGGGGSTSTQSSGIDEEFKPYLERVLSDVTDRYDREVGEGADSIVAALTPAQKEAIEKQKSQALGMIAGTGLYDTKGEEERALQDLLGSSTGAAYSSGVLGSARSDMAMQGALAGKAGQYQQQRRELASRGSELLGEVGAAEQAYDQARLDAPHTSASRYFGYLTNAPQSTTTTTSGGGK